MTVVRVVKSKNYTSMGNFHLREKEMSLKAKGLLSVMLSLPEDWDYSVSGLATINKESRNTINEILNELEKFGYLNRTRVRDEKGKILEVEYTIFESPYLKNQDMDNRDMENQDMDFKAQLNTNINKYLNNKVLNNKEKNIKKERFKKPTLEEVVAYCKERNNTVDAKRFFDYYDVANWKDVKNWKQKLITWESHQPTKQKEQLPEWFDKDLDIQEITEEEEKEFQNIINSFD